MHVHYTQTDFYDSYDDIPKLYQSILFHIFVIIGFNNLKPFTIPQSETKPRTKSGFKVDRQQWDKLAKLNLQVLVWRLLIM